jgi:hypothetical protein
MADRVVSELDCAQLSALRATGQQKFAYYLPGGFFSKKLLVPAIALL